MRHVKFLCLVLWVTVLPSVASLRPDLVEAVRSGKLREAHASWWGFNPEDSTRFLQEAISSRVPVLIVDRMPTAWVTRPLRGVSHQEIRFERGVELAAKPDEFLRKNDSLLTLRGVSDVKLSGYGAVFRMRRSDYMRAPYEKAEWRHALSILSCKRIAVEGLSFVESGGDGIYLGSAAPQFPNRDIHIKDVLCDRNYRQGISVISAENLLIEHTVLQNTGGTSPSAGIDFEPNHSKERLKNCVIRHCLSKNNNGNGFTFDLGQMNASSEPIDIRLENCYSEEDRSGFSFESGNSVQGAVRGKLTLDHCTFEQSRSHAVRISRKPRHGVRLTFDCCQIKNCAVGKENLSEVVFESHPQDLFPPDQIRLNNLRIFRPTERSWCTSRNLGRIAFPVETITGNVLLETPKEKRMIQLDSDWRKKTFPLLLTQPIPRVPLNWDQVVVMDQHPGDMTKLSPLRIRSRARYFFYADKPRHVTWLAVRKRIGSYADHEGIGMIRTLSGKEISYIPLKSEKLEKLGCDIPSKGFYTLDVNVGSHAFTLLASNVPVALDVSKTEQHLISSAGRAWVSVPIDTGRFAFYFSGSSGAERICCQVNDPTGTCLWKEESIGEWKRYEPPEGMGADGGLWSIDFSRPKRGLWEDFSVDVVGIPGCLFLSPEKYWTFDVLLRE